uniref:Uncharacterized protein n=1 Tax=Alexandrium andersonii TaxID=327968 RepID=A0A6U6N448_9DINO|mmetsp:Transcript_35612/g.80930  ORF Transcript_35612/g.80930 Transcript_35612/m.80930 type:complete len:101 (+) Transcript_35612:107-409(+)
MARVILTPILLCALAAALVLALGTGTLSFVGGTAAGASSNLRASQRVPDVAMNFFGGPPPTTTTTPPPMAIAADQNYVLGITLFFFASVAANANGFFGPW